MSAPASGDHLRIGMLIGGLGTGGTERQLFRLARGMAGRGHIVGVCLYGSDDGAGALAAEGISVAAAKAEGWRRKIRFVRKWYQTFNPQVAHGFMKRASTVAVLARPRGHPSRIIGSDLSTATYAPHRPALWGGLLAFGVSDVVVTQTELNRKSLERLAPWLRGKVSVIRNGVDIERYSPSGGASAAPEPGEPFRFACVGTVYRVKNPVGVVRAVAELVHRSPPPFHVDWYGRHGLEGDHAPSESYREARSLASELDVADRITFHGETRPIEPAYRRSHALLHASVQEGFPNAVVEGMACGLPIAVSRVSDLPLVVRTARNGVVFDERDPGAIADGMEALLRTSRDERTNMGRRSRELAVDWFARDRFIDEFEALYRTLHHGGRCSQGAPPPGVA